MLPFDQMLASVFDGWAIEQNPARITILDAAHTAFMEFGIRRTSMDVIARRGGVSPATLYRWFGTKKAIVSQVLARELRAALEQMEAAVDADAPPEVQLVEIVALSARIVRGDIIKLFHRLVETEPEVVLSQYTVHAGPFLQLMTAFGAHRIQRLIDRGAMPAVDPLFLAEWLVRVAHSLLLTPATRFPITDEDALRRLARETLSAFVGRPVGGGD